MSIMVTGGAGFIGKRIIRKLLERGEEVVCFDLNQPQINIQPFRGLMKLYKGDIKMSFYKGNTKGNPENCADFVPGLYIRLTYYVTGAHLKLCFLIN